MSCQSSVDMVYVSKRQRKALTSAASAHLDHYTCIGLVYILIRERATMMTSYTAENIGKLCLPYYCDECFAISKDTYTGKYRRIKLPKNVNVEWHQYVRCGYPPLQQLLLQQINQQDDMWCKV